MSLSLKLKDYQKLLKKEGFYNGEIDGQAGPLTALASLEYKLKGKTSSRTAKWIRFAIGELGTSELYGKRHNPRIIHYHSYTGLSAKEDEVAWCASFVNCCLLEGAGVKGTGSASAASFESWGKPASPEAFGAVLTTRTKTGSRRHVFFNCGSHNGMILGLGGNQSNKVSIVLRSVDEIVKARTA